MDTKYLHTFQTIVTEGSFSGAAQRLNYTQSTITFQVRQLEQELGVKLFEKIGRKMVLTKAGQGLIPYVEEMLRSLDKLCCLQRELEECAGELHIGVGETLLCYKLPAVLREFHRRAPRAKLFLRSMNCYEIRNELLGGTLDLGVFYEDVGGFGADLVTHPLGEYPLTLVASAATKAQHPDFTTPDRHIPVPFVINEVNCIFRQIFEQYLKERVIRLDHTIELWSIPTIKNLVKNDLGVTYLPRFAVQEELDSGELVAIPTLIDTTITAVCAHHKNKWLSPLMELFMEVLRDESAQ